jgi:hypothetical protein
MVTGLSLHLMLMKTYLMQRAPDKRAKATQPQSFFAEYGSRRSNVSYIMR